MSLSVAIMGHPKRAGFIEELAQALPEAELVLDREGDRWETGRRALLAYDPAADFHLVIQDDAIVCRDLVAGVERAVAVAGERPMSFYTGNVRPNRRIVVPAVARARRAGASWLAMEGPWWGVAIAVPTSHIKDLVAWGDKLTAIANYDRRITHYFKRRGIDCWYSTPSLVDHRPVEESPSLIAGRHGNRRALWFIGADRSALEIDWKRAAVGPKPAPVPLTQITKRRPGGKLRIADRRIYAHDAHGRLVLVAAPGQPIPPGFEIEGPLSEPEPAPATEQPLDNLDGLTVAQLRKIAEGRGVSLSGAKRKGAIVERLRTGA